MTTNDVAITFLGSGDAFGSGGRFHACFMVEAPQSRFLIDCGASAPLALKRHGVDPAAIDAIVVSHLHGDHFGGIPFLALDAQYLASRQRDLVIAGPAGVEERVPEAMESMYPGLLDDEMDFAIDYVTLRAGEAADVAGTTVVPGTARHGGGAPALSLRIECAGKTVAYSGDTGWTEDLFRVADGADLFICECSYYYEDTEGHLSYQTLLRRRADFACKRMILTHMGDDVLDRLETLELEAASDGARIVV
jgi:ribonuclease BN (tRNA processing enzyme)